MLGASHEGGRGLKAGIVTVLATLACGTEFDAPPDASSADASSSTPDATTPSADAGPSLVEGAPVPAVQIPLGPAEGAVVGLDDGIIARRGGDAWWIGTTTAAPLGPIGPITGGTSLGDGSALVLAEDGPRIWTGARLVPSQLGDALEGRPPRRAVRASNGALWIATDDTLHVYAGGVARRVSPSGLPTQGAQLAFGAPVRGRARTWVAAGGRLYALDEQEAIIEPAAPSGVDAIAIDVGGKLYAQAGGGLFVRDPSGLWSDEQRAIDEVGARWIALGGRGVARIEGLEIEPIVGLDRSAELVSTHRHGAIVRVGGELFDVRAGSTVAIAGLDDGAVLTASTAVVAHGPGVGLSLDGAPLGGRAFRGGLRAVIPAGTLAEGPHLLVARSGAEEARVSFTSLQGGVPTWSRDVEPLFRQRCASCHGAGGNAHNLDGAALWRGEIDRILAAVRERRMPLPPYRALDAAEIARIDGWKSAGFPE